MYKRRCRIAETNKRRNRMVNEFYDVLSDSVQCASFISAHAAHTHRTRTNADFVCRHTRRHCVLKQRVRVALEKS